MVRRALALRATLLSLSLLLVSWNILVVSAGTTYVYIYPHRSDHYPGRWFNSQYAGVVNFDVRRNNDRQGTQGYCIDYNGAIYLGHEYQVELKDVSDTSSEWKQIAYILTWYYPPASNDAAVVVQGALWWILPPHVIPSFILAYKSEILMLDSDSSGKDVIRNGDIFQWIYPQTGTNAYIVANPGETVTLRAQINNSVGNPRPGVRVIFSIVSGSGTLNPAIGWTNENGVVEVKVTPSSTDVRVQAYTRGVWPQYYLDLEDNHQNLIGMETTYQLTVEAELWIFANIHVIPELPLGTLGAVATYLSALAVKRRRTTSR